MGLRAYKILKSLTLLTLLCPFTLFALSENPIQANKILVQQCESQTPIGALAQVNENLVLETCQGRPTMFRRAYDLRRDTDGLHIDIRVKFSYRVYQNMNDDSFQAKPFKAYMHLRTKECAQSISNWAAPSMD